MVPRNDSYDSRAHRALEKRENLMIIQGSFFFISQINRIL